MTINTGKLFVEATEIFLEECRIEGKTDATIKAYGQALDRYIKRLAPEEDPSSPLSVRRYLLAMTELSPESRNRYFRETRRFFRWAMEKNLTDNDPFDGLKNIRIPEKLLSPYSKAEIARLIAACDEPTGRGVRDSLIIMLFLDTGVRRGELLGIDLDDVDLVGRRIRIRHAKGGNQRIVPFGSKCAAHLNRYLEFRGNTPGALWWAVHSTGYLRRNSPLRSSGLRQMLGRLGRNAGVARTHAHRFRHTFATWAVSQDAREIDLQFLLGHKSVEMVRRYTASYRSEQAAKRHYLFSPGDQMLKTTGPNHRS